MSYVPFRLRESHMLHVKCLCWSLGHAEQLLFSCLCSKVSICNYVTCHISHVTCNMSHCACHMSYVKCLCWSLGHAEQLLFSCLCSKVAYVKSIPTDSHVVATTTLVTIRRANCVCRSSRGPREEQNNVGWLPKLNWGFARAGEEHYTTECACTEPQISFGNHPTLFWSSWNLARAARRSAHTICTSDGD